MSELIRVDDVFKVLLNFYIHGDMDAKHLDDMEKAMLELPIIDAVEVVRCRDCRYHDMSWGDAVSHFCEQNGFGTKDDWYCGDGKRRKDNALD